MEAEAQAKAEPRSIVYNPAEILGSTGPIAKTFSNYEPRAAQIQMSEAVLKNMQDRKHLFAEAGTGTGKSYAFLIPAIEMALAGEGPIVISTNTIALQEQIFRKDIPDLKKYLNIPHLRVVLRKGRGNYLSRRRLKVAGNFITDLNLLTQLEDIETWAESTQTGSVQDLQFIPSSEVWEFAQSDQYDCLGKKCPTYKSCFYYKSKEEAEQAHLIICNHSLLALDLALKTKSDEQVTILPPYKHLIVDEAHALEEAIRKSETFEWKQGSAAALAKRATSKKNRGFLDRLLEVGDVPSKAVANAKEMLDLLRQFVEVNDLFFEHDVKPFVKNDQRTKDIPTAKRIHPSDLSSPRSESLLKTISSIAAYMTATVSILAHAAEEDTVSKEVKDLAMLLTSYNNRINEVSSELHRVIQADTDQDQPYPTHVSSVETSEYNGKAYYSLVNTPIFVRQIAQKLLFSRVPSITLTSATLTINKSFDHITRNLGAIPAMTATLQLPHVFDYQKQVKLYLATNLPEDPWNKPKERDAYFDLLARKIEKYVLQTNGNALVLCTSNLQLKALHDRTIKKLEAAGLNVVRQGGGLTREQLVHEIKTVPHTVLFGVDSFWTGIDVPGQNLQNIIIPKLPFPPPTPLSEAQEEIYTLWNKGQPRNKQRMYFTDKTVPEVAIKMQQGFGRLIRHRNDTGIVVILDGRLKTKPYGRSVLGSLPECTVIYDRE